MTLDTLIMLSGAFVALLPFLGFPNSWDRVLFLLAGVFIVILGVITRRRMNERVRRASNAMRMTAFSQTPPTSKSEGEHDAL